MVSGPKSPPSPAEGSPSEVGSVGWGKGQGTQVCSGVAAPGLLALEVLERGLYSQEDTESCKEELPSRGAGLCREPGPRRWGNYASSEGCRGLSLRQGSAQ